MQKEKTNLSTKNATYRKITLQIGKDFFFFNFKLKGKDTRRYFKYTKTNRTTRNGKYKWENRKDHMFSHFIKDTNCITQL